MGGFFDFVDKIPVVGQLVTGGDGDFQFGDLVRIGGLALAATGVGTAFAPAVMAAGNSLDRSQNDGDGSFFGGIEGEDVAVAAASGAKGYFTGGLDPTGGLIGSSGGSGLRLS